MRKIIFMVIPLLLISVACGNKKIKEREEIKTISIKAVENYCNSTFKTENKTFKVKTVTSCLINEPQAVVKIDVAVKEDGNSVIKPATVVCEKDNNNTWHVKNVLVE